MHFEKLGPSDAADAFRVWGDRDTVKFTNWRHTPTANDCAERLQKVLEYYGKEVRHFGPYCIRETDHRFVGLIGAQLHNAEGSEYELWYILPREEWGRGIATKAAGLLIQQVIESKRARRLVATAVAANPASSRVLEKNGFVRGQVEPTGFQRDGLALPIIHYTRGLA